MEGEPHAAAGAGVEVVRVLARLRRCRYAGGATRPCYDRTPVRPALGRRAAFLVGAGLTAPEVAVFATDPVAVTANPVRVVAGDAAMLAELRASLMDDHLSPVLEQIRTRSTSAGGRCGARSPPGSPTRCRAPRTTYPSPYFHHVRDPHGPRAEDLVDLAPLEDGRRASGSAADLLPRVHTARPRICGLLNPLEV